MITYRTG